MKKTLYSLMLSEDVVNEIDRLAHKYNTNRSNLINQILAERVNILTPEKRINDIFTAMEQIMNASEEIVPFFAPNTVNMSLKSSLQYKYRPTVKYDIVLNRDNSPVLGELAITFRSTSGELISGMREFFKLWISIEQLHLFPFLKGMTPEYALVDGRFVRSLLVPQREFASDDLASALCKYVKLFDDMMKGYLTGKYDSRDVEICYFSMLQQAEFLF